MMLTLVKVPDENPATAMTAELLRPSRRHIAEILAALADINRTPGTAAAVALVRPGAARPRRPRHRPHRPP
jgi:hypothetical protein